MSGGTNGIGHGGAGMRASVVAKGAKVPKTKTVSCLLIDDSKFDRQRVRRIAEQSSIEVTFTEASNLDEALNALRARAFDVVLLDQSLPDGEGTVVVELLNRHLGDQAPPIIMVSGSQEAAMPARAFASGCFDYIGKDGLNIPGLEKAIIASLTRTRKQAPASGTVSLVQHREELRSLADDTRLELRIPLSRMLRTITRISDQHPAAAPELAALTGICREMWDYLDQLGPRAPDRAS